MREYRDRQRSLAQLAAHLDVWAGELGAWETGRREPVGPFDLTAPDGTGRSVSVGDEWSNRHGIHRFRSRQSVRGIGAGETVELRLDFGGEALVRLVGEDGRQIDAFGANPRHRRFAPLPEVPFHIEAEVAARTLMGVPNRDPRLALAELATVEGDLRDLRRRIEVMRDTMGVVEDGVLARAIYETAMIGLSLLRLPTATAGVGPRLARLDWARDIWERSFEPVDDPLPLDARARDSVAAALVSIDAGLEDLRREWPKAGRVLTTGHAHIDYAWLWPQPETVRKIVRTFNGVTSLMRSHPEMTFLQSSSLFYDHAEQEDPAVFAEIRRLVAEGRWEVAGGMLIESDTNMPSAEAFLRQFLLGQRYFQDRFGVTCRTAWLPDTFGFTGVMPQILRHSGLEAMVTIKVTWNESNEMPDNLFRWNGTDGSSVLVHTFNARNNDGYNMQMTPAALVEVWKNHTARDLADTVISSYGWGDGGGGPDPDQVEIMPVLNLMPAIPGVAHGSIQKHIDGISERLHDAPALPVWTGEMYFEYHRATLTTQGRTKSLNRRAELALVAAEAAAGIAALSGVTGVGAHDLADDWTLMLRNQFHDILPGSSIREVYEQTEAELAGVIGRADARIEKVLAAFGGKEGADARDGLVVANLSGSAKPRWQLEQSDPLPSWMSPQKTAGGYVATSNRPLHPLSVALVGDAGASRSAGVVVSGLSMENDVVSVRLDDHGRIAGLFDRRCGRELIVGAANRLMLYRNDLPRRYDAWDIEVGFALGGEEVTQLERCEVTAEGPHLGEITLVRRTGGSRIVQRLRLWANSPRVDIVTDLDWHDRRSYLRAEFPLNVLSDHAEFDQAIGVTRRPTHDNTTWQKAQFESCGHRFVSLSEADWGGVLLSADKYGFSAKGNRLTLSLVRGPVYPDMMADEGHHRFTYGIMPHDGRCWSADVQAEADLMNDPLRAVAAAVPVDRDIVPICWEGREMRFHALKPAEDGEGHILRLSESAGGRGPFRLRVPAGMGVGFVDGLERPQDAICQVGPNRLVSARVAREE